jgi:hypothetical protein
LRDVSIRRALRRARAPQSRIRRPMHLRALAGLALAIAVATTLRAQAVPPPDSATTSAVMLGGTIMIPSSNVVSGSEFSAIGLTVGPARLNRVGPDLAFVIVPRGIVSGALAGAVRANIGLPVPLGAHTLLVPSIGVTLVGGLGSGGGAGARGVNGSVALLYFADPPETIGSSIGLRLALTLHRFGSGSNGSLRMLELGLVRWKR